jgi:hypothetical protein
MARKQGFVANRAGIGNIAKTDPGIIAAVTELTDKLAERSGGQVETYVTDRFMAAVVVDGESQAKDGAATKAAGALGLRLS